MTNRANKKKKQYQINFAARPDDSNVLRVMEEQNAQFKRENPGLAAELIKLSAQMKNSAETRRRAEACKALLVEENDGTQGIMISYSDGE